MSAMNKLYLEGKDYKQIDLKALRAWLKKSLRLLFLNLKNKRSASIGFQFQPGADLHLSVFQFSGFR